jgi:hypothetical protein
MVLMVTMNKGVGKIDRKPVTIDTIGTIRDAGGASNLPPPCASLALTRGEVLAYSPHTSSLWEDIAEWTEN